MRRFKLINSAGESYDITTEDAFFHDPEGLGFQRNDIYHQVGSRFILANTSPAQGEIKGKLNFISDDPYTDYRRFVDFTKDNLRLVYEAGYTRSQLETYGDQEVNYSEIGDGSYIGYYDLSTGSFIGLYRKVLYEDYEDFSWEEFHEADVVYGEFDSSRYTGTSPHSEGWYVSSGENFVQSEDEHIVHGTVYYEAEEMEDPGPRGDYTNFVEITWTNDSPSGMGLYVLSEGEYVLSEDQYFEIGTVYFKKDGPHSSDFCSIYSCAIVGEDSTNAIAQGTKILCNGLTSLDYDNRAALDYAKNGICLSSDPYKVSLCLRKETLGEYSIEDWINTNRPQFVYRLASPVKIEYQNGKYTLKVLYDAVFSSSTSYSDAKETENAQLSLSYFNDSHETIELSGESISVDGALNTDSIKEFTIQPAFDYDYLEDVPSYFGGAGTNLVSEDARTLSGTYEKGAGNPDDAIFDDTEIATVHKGQTYQYYAEIEYSNVEPAADVSATKIAVNGVYNSEALKQISDSVIVIPDSDLGNPTAASLNVSFAPEDFTVVTKKAFYPPSRLTRRRFYAPGKFQLVNVESTNLLNVIDSTSVSDSGISVEITAATFDYAAQIHISGNPNSSSVEIPISEHMWLPKGSYSMTWATSGPFMEGQISYVLRTPESDISYSCSVSAGPSSDESIGDHVTSIELDKGMFMDAFILLSEVLSLEVTVKPILSFGTEYIDDYISGRCTYDQRYVCKTYDITIPEAIGPVYGANLDLLGGRMEKTWEHIGYYSQEEIPNKWYSSNAVYAEGTLPPAGSEVVYELESPVVYNFDPIEGFTLGPSISGRNHIFMTQGLAEYIYQELSSNNGHCNTQATINARPRLAQITVHPQYTKSFETYSHNGPWQPGDGLNKLDLKGGQTYPDALGGTNWPINLTVNSGDILSPYYLTAGQTYTFSCVLEYSSGATGYYSPFVIVYVGIGNGDYSYKLGEQILDLGTDPAKRVECKITFTPSADLAERLKNEPFAIQIAGSSGYAGVYFNLRDACLAVGSEALESWEPYANVVEDLHFKTWSELYLAHSDTNDYSDYDGDGLPSGMTQYFYDLQPDSSTSFVAGKVDILAGEVQAYDYIKSYNGETISKFWFSNMDSRDLVDRPSIGAEVVDEGLGRYIAYGPNADLSFNIGDNYFACSFEPGIPDFDADVDGVSLRFFYANDQKDAKDSEYPNGQINTGIGNTDMVYAGIEETDIFETMFGLDDPGDLVDYESEVVDGHIRGSGSLTGTITPDNDLTVFLSSAAHNVKSSGAEMTVRLSLIPYNGSEEEGELPKAAEYLDEEYEALKDLSYPIRSVVEYGGYDYQTFYRDVRVSQINKTEIDLYGTLEIDITFKCLSPWMSPFRSLLHNVVVSEADPFTWPEHHDNIEETVPTWNIVWGQGSAQMVLNVLSDGTQRSPCLLKIDGPLTNPKWSHFVNGELVAEGSCGITIGETQYLLISSFEDSFFVWLYNEDGSVAADVYPRCDFSKEIFIFLEYGENVIRVSDDGGNYTNAMIEGSIYYESV